MDRRVSLLRIVACFMVILLHVSAENFHAFGEKWWAANFYDSLTRACVPIFFMISGANLLSKDEALGTFFRKRFLKIIPPLIFWSCFFLWWLAYNGVIIGNWDAWVVKIMSGQTMFHLWYLYALVGLYAVVPVLRKFYQHSSRQEHLAFILLWFAVASIYPTIMALMNDTQCGSLQLGLLATQYHLTYFGGYIGYLLLGAYIADSRGSLMAGLTIFASCSAATMAVTYLWSQHLGGPCEFFYIYLSPLVVGAAYGLYTAFMGMKPGVPSRWVMAISDCTLGIYCIHIFMIDPIFKARAISATIGNPWVTSLTTSICVFAASFVLIYILRLIKPLRYIT
ncbi:surface polysaccharide O-acyltransferase-like enzyme [Janthinobacterium sp. 64]|nr:surface polysaccharide O-acyltransferase-like enzyme [Janthinobacterium sp. 64]